MVATVKREFCTKKYRFIVKNIKKDEEWGVEEVREQTA